MGAETEKVLINCLKYFCLSLKFDQRKTIDVFIELSNSLLVSNRQSVFQAIRKNPSSTLASVRLDFDHYSFDRLSQRATIQSKVSLWAASVFGFGKDIEMLYRRVELKDSQINAQIGSFFNQLANRSVVSSDMELYDELYSTVQPHLLSSLWNGSFSEAGAANRAMSRALTIKRSLEKYSPQISSYLDVGCGNGEITVALGKLFDLPPSGIRGCDIQNSCCPSEVKETTHQQMTFKTNQVNKLPYDDESCDLVTAMMVLHHVLDDCVDSMCEEIFRVVRSGGFFVLREHNCNEQDEVLSNFLDQVHGMYSLVWSNPREMNPEEFSNHFCAQYRSHREWKQKLLRVGFRELEFIPQPHHPQRPYWALYWKPSYNNDIDSHSLDKCSKKRDSEGTEGANKRNKVDV